MTEFNREEYITLWMQKCKEFDEYLRQICPFTYPPPFKSRHVY